MAIDTNTQQQIADLEQRRAALAAERAAREQAERDELEFLEQSAAQLVELQIQQADQDFDEHLAGAESLVTANREAVEALRAAMTAYDLPATLDAYQQVRDTFNRLRAYNEAGLAIVWDNAALKAEKLPQGHPASAEFRAGVNVRNMTRTYFNRLNWGIEANGAVAQVIGQERNADRKRVLIGIGFALTGQVADFTPDYDPVRTAREWLQSQIVGGY